MRMENPAQPTAFLENLAQQQEKLGQAEETLLEYSKELTGRLLELQELYHAARGQMLGELRALRDKNEQLCQLLADREQTLAQTDQGTNANRGDLEVAHLKNEVAQLQRQLQEKDLLIEEQQSQQSQRTLRDDASPEDSDAADYEAELNEFRRQIEADRESLNAEIAQLRARNAELNEAAREAELELSRERAHLARERAQLDRLREEIRQELERAQRDGGVHERLAPLQRIKEEFVERQRATTKR
jgi:chromosome segregation ATPase